MDQGVRLPKLKSSLPLVSKLVAAGSFLRPSYLFSACAEVLDSIWLAPPKRGTLGANVAI